jgi:hypothetical protein
MTSPEWEAANEDDSDRFPQTSQDPMRSEAARVARYVPAIRQAGMGLPGPEVPGRIARAVVAVADEERAALVARAEAAEAKLQKVEALANVTCPCGCGRKIEMVAAEAIRAALADAPAEQRASRHHHSRKAKECVHNGSDCCVECCEPGGVYEQQAGA